MHGIEMVLKCLQGERQVLSRVPPGGRYEAAAGLMRGG